MALNTSKCNHLTPLHFMGLIVYVTILLLPFVVNKAYHQYTLYNASRDEARLRSGVYSLGKTFGPAIRQRF